jgi:hypothetical protein
VKLFVVTSTEDDDDGNRRGFVIGYSKDEKKARDFIAINEAKNRALTVWYDNRLHFKQERLRLIGIKPPEFHLWLDGKRDDYIAQNKLYKDEVVKLEALFDEENPKPEEPLYGGLDIQMIGELE